MTIPRTMLLWGGTVVLVLGFLVLVGTAFFAEWAQKKKFRRRMNRALGIELGQALPGQRPAVPTKGPSFLRADPDDSWVDPFLCRLLGRKLMPRWLTRSQRVYMIAFAVIGALGAAMVASFLLRWPFYVPLVPSLGIGWFVLRSAFNMLRRKEEMRFLEAFPEALGIFVRMVRAGLPVPEAIRTVGYEGPNAVAGDFRRMSERLTIGDNIGDVFADAAQRVEIPDFRFFVVAVNIQRETGGNLAAVLDNLADIIRRRRSARQRAGAVMSEVRASIAVLTALPFIVAIFLFMTNRPYLMVLFVTERGRMVLGAAIGMLAGGLLVMRWLIKRTLGSM